MREMMVHIENPRFRVDFEALHVKRKSLEGRSLLRAQVVNHHSLLGPFLFLPCGKLKQEIQFRPLVLTANCDGINVIHRKIPQNQTLIHSLERQSRVVFDPYKTLLLNVRYDAAINYQSGATIMPLVYS